MSAALHEVLPPSWVGNALNDCSSFRRGAFPILGDGQVSVDGDALVVTGRKSLRLANGVEIEERLDPDRFRRNLATEAGVVTDPPVDSRHQATTVNGLVLDPHEASHRRTTSDAGLVVAPPQALGIQAACEIPGLIYEPDFVAEEEETNLLAWIDGAEWSTELRRRVQHYGWRYDYRKRQIDKVDAHWRVTPLGTGIGPATSCERVGRGTA